jgi:hypothetical protein
MKYEALSECIRMLLDVRFELCSHVDKSCRLRDTEWWSYQLAAHVVCVDETVRRDDVSAVRSAATTTR